MVSNLTTPSIEWDLKWFGYFGWSKSQNLGINEGIMLAAVRTIFPSG